MQIFNFENTSDIRTFIYDEEPLFVAKDIATALGYLNTKSAIMLHCIDAITVQDFRMEILTKIRNSNNNNSSNTLLLELKDLHPQLKLIYDYDVYALIFGSKLPSAQRFKKWVYKDVLQSIRKTGSYTVPTPTPIPTPSSLITKQDFIELKNEILSLKLAMPVFEFKEHGTLIPFPGYDVGTLVDMASKECQTKISVKDGYDYLISLDLVDKTKRYLPTALGVRTNAVNVASSAFLYTNNSTGITQKIIVHRDFTNDFIKGLYKFLNINKSSQYLPSNI
jgi:prophage antirepressor-like protein